MLNWIVWNRTVLTINYVGTKTILILKWIVWNRTVCLNWIAWNRNVFGIYCVIILNWIVWNRTVHFYKNGFDIKLPTKANMS